MDYKYIECLVERYFRCQTTVEEERILCDFFRQEDVPKQLAQYQPLFAAFVSESGQTVSDSFDQKLAARLQSMQTEGQIMQTEGQPIQTEGQIKQMQGQTAQAAGGKTTNMERLKGHKVRFVRFNRSLTPFYKAVASIALIITVGVTSSKYWNSKDTEPVNYNYASYQDTYNDPQVACEQVTGALKDLSDALKGSGLQASDSTARSDAGQSVPVQSPRTNTNATAE